MSTLPTEQYTELLAQKCQHLYEVLSPFSLPDLEVFESAKRHFRLRAEFRIWHQGERCFYAMFDPEDKRKPIEINDFPIGCELINRLMRELLAQVLNSEVLKHKLFQVEFLCTLSGDALITLIYHKPLDEHWQSVAEQLQRDLGVCIIGRSRKQKIVLSRDYVEETLHVDDLTLHYQQLEGGFTQPNGEMNQHMLSWARSVSADSQVRTGDLLELYCGHGNFTLALADLYPQVLATEISKTSVKAAQVNIAKNNAENVRILRLSSEEFVQAMNGTREFRRLKDIDLSSYDIRTVLVDPPRAGLDDESVKQIQQYDNIIYISCNPNTLAENLNVLSQTHQIKRLALFDQFPYTHHIETGVFLQREMAH